jgi:hypothetical protein
MLVEVLRAQAGSAHIAQDLSTEEFAELEMMNCILVFRDLFMLTVDQFEGVQQVSRRNRRFGDAVLHRFLLSLQVESLSFLFLLVFLG